jgi:hypothetical protein
MGKLRQTLSIVRAVPPRIRGIDDLSLVRLKR